MVEKADTGRERHVLEIQWNSEITKTSGHIQLIVVFFFSIDGNVYTFLSILLGSNDGLKLIQKKIIMKKKTFTDIFSINIEK